MKDVSRSFDAVVETNIPFEYCQSADGGQIEISGSHERILPEEFQALIDRLIKLGPGSFTSLLQPAIVTE